MTKKYTGYNAKLKQRSRELRKNMTRQEKRLWYDFLRTYPVKIYRQRSVDQFILDFYCSKAHVAIELDGGQHYTKAGKIYDEQRTAVLNGYGIKVLRVTNREVDHHFSSVCQMIDNFIQEALK